MMRNGASFAVLLLVGSVVLAVPATADSELQAELKFYPGGEDDGWDGAWATPEQTIVFDGTESTAASSYDLDIGADGTYEYEGDEDGIFEHSFEEPGEYDVRLRVSNGLVTDRETRNVTVAENQPPTAEFTYMPEEPEPSEEVELDPSASSDDHGVVLFYWEAEDGSWEEGQTPDQENPEVEFPEPGTYNVTLTAYDAHAAHTQTTVEIAVGLPPEADLAVSSTEVETGETVGFDPSGSEPGSAEIDHVTLDVDGDGKPDYTQETAEKVTHTYDAEGSFTASLTVHDEHGFTDTAAVTISVKAPTTGSSGGGSGGGGGTGGGGGGSSASGGGVGEDTDTDLGQDEEDDGSGDDETEADGPEEDGPDEEEASREASVQIEVEPSTPTVDEEVTLSLVTDTDVEEVTWFVDGERLEDEPPVGYNFTANGTYELEVLAKTPDGRALADTTTVTVEGSPATPGEEDRSLPAPGAGLVLVGALAALGLHRRR